MYDIFLFACHLSQWRKYNYRDIPRTRHNQTLPIFVPLSCYQCTTLLYCVCIIYFVKNLWWQIDHWQLQFIENFITLKLNNNTYSAIIIGSIHVIVHGGLPSHNFQLYIIILAMHVRIIYVNVEKQWMDWEWGYNAIIGFPTTLSQIDQELIIQFQLLCGKFKL
jgi:hypothetical protein